MRRFGALQFVMAMILPRMKMGPKLYSPSLTMCSGAVSLCQDLR